MRPANPLICGAMAFLMGAQLAFGPDAWFSSGSFDVQFTLGRTNWGIAWMVGGVAAWVFHWTNISVIGSGVLLAVIVAWGLCSWVGVFTGSSKSYNSPLVWTAVSSMLLSSVIRFGSGTRRPR